jgi:hypothetical protein
LEATGRAGVAVLVVVDDDATDAADAVEVFDEAPPTDLVSIACDWVSFSCSVFV